MLSDPATYVSLLYLAVVAAVGFVVAMQARNRDLLEYFLAGRGTGSIVLALSLAVTTLGAIGVVLLINPDIHSQGTALLALAVLCSLMVVLGTVVSGKYQAAGVMTTPGLVARRFGRFAGTSLGAVFVLLIIFVRLPLVLLGGSWMLTALTGWEPLTTAMLMLVVAGLYTTAGGFPSVLFTQAVQGVTVVFSVVMLLGLHAAGQPLVVDLPIGPPEGTIPGPIVPFTASLAIVAVWYFWADQFVIQRVLSARGRLETRRGVLLGLAFVSVIALLGVHLIGGGTILEGPVAGDTLPVAMAALLILSLTLSAVAGMLQSAAAMVAIDIVQPFRRTATELSLVLVGRLATTGAAVVVLLLVSALGPMSPAGLLTFVNAHVAVTPPAAALFVGVLFVRKMTPRGGTAAMLVGGVLALAFPGIPAGWSLSGATFAVASFALTMAALVVFSYLPARQAGAHEPEAADVSMSTEHADAVATR